LRFSHLTTQLGSIFTAFSKGSSLEGRPKIRSNLILRSFWLPTGDFRLAPLPYSMILALRVPLLGRKIALRQVKAF
jgi:hypothetical protein